MIAKGRKYLVIFCAFFFLHAFLYSLLYSDHILYMANYNFVLLFSVFGMCWLGRNYINFDVVEDFEVYYVFASCILLLIFLYYSLYDPKIFKNVDVINIISSVASLGTIKSIAKMFYLTHKEKKSILVDEIEKSFKTHNI